MKKIQKNLCKNFEGEKNLGITLSDGGISTATWQFELRDLDLRCHPHAPGSIALLESSAINLTGNRQLGIPSTRFALLLLDAGLVCGFFKATWDNLNLKKEEGKKKIEVNENIVNLYTQHQAIKFSSNGGSFLIYENLVFISCHLGF
ncbi:hypothetical protein IEQ34_017374 [Dendrobium chrysotoxum]|uniref:Uncharacterized protein n=1 Tax=Dendrobium chrysotoxum TaxID=161865 RepID=A0AAV7GBC3_DENCH|nr:hypothetical protein IEQ34_017374 [Dendrobium chrysotoxum]